MVATKKTMKKTPEPAKAPEKRTKEVSEVLAKVEASRARGKTKTAGGAGRKGAEKPDDDEAAEVENRKIEEQEEKARPARQAGHFSSTAQRRIGGSIGAQNRAAQKRRDVHHNPR